MHQQMEVYLSNKAMNKFFCEIIQNNDDVIKFQMIGANNADEALHILKRNYIDIKECVVKNMITGLVTTNLQFRQHEDTKEKRTKIY